VKRSRVVAGLALVVLGGSLSIPLSAQLPLTSAKASGQSVSPAYEGWYRNPDGTYTLSFGYYNRNTNEVVEIPIGKNNFVSPGAPNQGQPSEFQPRRNWGVFGVKVPADFGKKEVVWTLTFRDVTYAIPGSLHQNWQIDALEGEAGSGNTPPALRFSESGAEGRGPFGITEGPVAATAGKTSCADRLGERRWQRRDERGEFRSRHAGASHARVVQASGARQGGVRTRNGPHRGRGWAGHIERDIRRAG
jgi:hypothetical protein